MTPESEQDNEVFRENSIMISDYWVSSFLKTCIIIITFSDGKIAQAYRGYSWDVYPCPVLFVGDVTFRNSVLTNYRKFLPERRPLPTTSFSRGLRRVARSGNLVPRHSFLYLCSVLWRNVFKKIRCRFWVELFTFCWKER